VSYLRDEAHKKLKRVESAVVSFTHHHAVAAFVGDRLCVRWNPAGGAEFFPDGGLGFRDDVAVF